MCRQVTPSLNLSTAARSVSELAEAPFAVPTSTGQQAMVQLPRSLTSRLLSSSDDDTGEEPTVRVLMWTSNSDVHGRGSRAGQIISGPTLSFTLLINGSEVRLPCEREARGVVVCAWSARGRRVSVECEGSRVQGSACTATLCYLSPSHDATKGRSGHAGWRVPHRMTPHPPLFVANAHYRSLVP